MSISGPWETKSPASVSRKNKTSILTLSGTDINSLDKTKYKLVACNATGSGYTINHVYHFSDDGSQVDDLTDLTNHLHTTTSGQGGHIRDIYAANPEHFNQSMCRPTDWVKALWNQTVSGTGTIEDGTGGNGERYIRLRPNGTSGSGATISYPMAANAGFPHHSLMGYVYQLETASSLAFHIGWNADDITAADSNTSKVQLEVCTATNNNHWLRTANGTNNSASDMGSGTAITTNKTSCQFLNWNTGTPSVTAQVNATNSFTKTTHIATSGSNTLGNIMKFSVKNSTGADRPLRAYGAHLSFTTDSSWIYGQTTP